MVNQPWIDNFVKSIFKPGAVVVSYGMRGGGKTHCAVSFCQMMIDGKYPGMPQHVVLVTNVIFVRRREDGGFDTASPPGVYTIHKMRDLFPIVVKALEEHGRKDTMVILLLDEAQNFLLGDDNGKTEMAASMKKFCGIIRKFNLCLWLLSPAMRNLGPAFRNFLDADTDPGNVNATLQKENREAERFLAANGLKADPRSVVFVKTGEREKPSPIPVPTVSWTRDPETIAPGEYVYDHLSSADFDIGDFPFREFVQYISGRSSYEMVQAIKDFYAGAAAGEDAPSEVDVEIIVRKREMEILAACINNKIPLSTAAAILGKHPNTITKWKKKLEEGGKGDPT